MIGKKYVEHYGFERQGIRNKMQSI